MFVTTLGAGVECWRFLKSIIIIIYRVDLIFSDGAAALVLVSGEKALKLGLLVIARITGYADAAQVMGIYISGDLNK